MSSIENKQFAFFSWLLDQKADPNAMIPSTGEHRLNLILLAKNVSEGELYLFLIGWTAGHAAAKHCNVQMQQDLAKRGIDQSQEASHRRYGTNVRPSEVEQQTRSLIQSQG